MLLTIKTFLEGRCPLLAGKNISLNFLEEQVGAVGLFATGDAPAIKQFADGGGLYSYDFVIALRAAYDGDVDDAEKSIHFLEGISDFLEQTGENGVYPSLLAGEIPQGFITKMRPAPVSNNTKTTRLQMVCSLLYEKKGCKH